MLTRTGRTREPDGALGERLFNGGGEVGGGGLGQAPGVVLVEAGAMVRQVAAARSSPVRSRPAHVVKGSIPLVALNGLAAQRLGVILAL